MLDRNHFVFPSFSVWVYSIFKKFYFFIFWQRRSSLLHAGVLAVEPGSSLSIVVCRASRCSDFLAAEHGL